MLTLNQILTTYGKPGDQKNTTTIQLPYPMRIAWAPSQKVNAITCHKKIAAPLLNVFNDLLQHYGLQTIQQLGIDLFGGCLNVRPKRGYEKKYEALIRAGKETQAYEYLSRHAWAIAIDLDPARNTLKETKATARFARPEYKPMIDIFYKHGFIGYGPEKNFDWMHFEINI